MDLIIEYLPSIIAGLFPSLMALVPTIVVAVKNIKVNKQVDELLGVVDKLKSGNITIGEALDNTIKQMNGVKQQVVYEFNHLHDKAKEAITADVTVLQDKIGKQISSFELNMQEIQLALMQNIERMKNYDNVPTLPKEGQEEVHPSED